MENRIVVGIDGSLPARAALLWADREASLRDAWLDVVWTHEYPMLVDPLGGVYPMPWLYRQANENQKVLLAKELVEVLGVERAAKANAISLCGGATRMLLDQAKGAELLVVGSRGLSGWKSVMLGSTAVQCTHHAPCPVVVVHPADEKAILESVETTPNSKSSRIVVGVDGSVSSVAALSWAMTEAMLRKVSILAVHSWDVSATSLPEVFAATDKQDLQTAATNVLDAAMRSASEGLTDLPPLERLVREGGPAEVLLKEGRHANLVVVGTRGHGGFVGLLFGSVATQVLNHSTCPVVVVPA